MRSIICALALCAATPALARGGIIVPDGDVKVQDIELRVPSGWTSTQEAQNGDVILAAFTKGSEHLTVYCKKGTSFDLRKTFVNGSQVTNAERRQVYGRHEWTLLETKKDTAGYATVYVSAFMTSFQGNTYYGYSSAPSQAAAAANVQSFLAAMD